MSVKKALPLIKTEHLAFSYGDQPILEHVNLHIDKGDYLGIIGPNGSGKTTLLRLLLGLLEPTKGEITILGHKPAELEQRSAIGYVPQRVAQANFQFPAIVREVVRSGRTARRGLFQSFNEEDEAIVDKALKLAEITHLEDRLISNLSGGERQRVFIARALAGEPELLILDEPTVGVDVASQETFYSLLCSLNKHEGLTIILVSHDVDVIAQEVKTLLFLNRKVIAYGSPRSIMKTSYLEKLYGRNVQLIEHHH
jgi:zinc transport system ATP-binding protein